MTSVPPTICSPAEAPSAALALHQALETGAGAAEVLGQANQLIGELGARMGIELTHVSPERLVATMPVVGNRQPFGLLHGGASAVLAESLGSMHAAVLVRPPTMAVGVELNCSHHRSAASGVITGHSVPIHVGRTMASFDIAIADDEGARLCTARLTCYLRQATPR